ncbi:uncharacterized protein B0I36DRAFT_86355 [Microdochium trichocladiopsis]|uniref:Uncharacterized protein n=1 Tax=Microdochium trichocladiopsis TaxID=1682393 RepID=A0A9P9BWD9_9PEZI|nr:uncharacterized protein B0I36DRAFT_86355 [Microdochium trichocladiopsis]KAH7034981.1 hypothetical protein B0I36DRAFT_86355 [Microdochium trichocladiopsis]
MICHGRICIPSPARWRADWPLYARTLRQPRRQLHQKRLEKLDYSQAMSACRRIAPLPIRILGLTSGGGQVSGVRSTYKSIVAAYPRLSSACREPRASPGRVLGISLNRTQFLRRAVRSATEYIRARDVVPSQTEMLMLLSCRELNQPTCSCARK